MARYPSYDALFSALLTAYQNATDDPGRKPVVGDELYMRAAGLASALWGLYREAEWIKNQILPTTADPAEIERHAEEYGLSRGAGETHEALLQRLLNRLRNPPAAGNEADFVTWAMEVEVDGERAQAVRCYPAGLGAGTVVLVVSRADGAPTQALLDRIRAVCFERCAVRPTEIFVYAPSFREVDVSIRMQGGDRGAAEARIRAYVNELLPGQMLFSVVLEAFCRQSGATLFEMDLPNQVPGPFERVRLRSLTWL